jgi:hypothetical protein
MRAEPHARKIGGKISEIDQTKPAKPSSVAAAKAQSGCTRMNKAMHAVATVIAAATQL